MSKQITITNGIITAAISTLGAEFKSIIKDGREYLWEGNPDVWPGQAPVLFPICGGLKDDKFVFEDNEYTLPKHGFGRRREFQIEELNQSSATFLLNWDEATLLQYPFKFELRITYSLVNSKIEVKYSVKNTEDRDMYFSIGSHEAYSCPEGIEEYTLFFDKTEELRCNVLNGNLLEHNTYSIGENSAELPLKYDFFAVDALTFLNLKSRSAKLVHRSSGRTITVDFDGFDYLFVWTKPNGKYLCIEPWCGIPDFEDSDFDITKKPGIVKLGKNAEKVLVHTITL